jgi:hypothetical protein
MKLSWLSSVKHCLRRASFKLVNPALNTKVSKAKNRPGLIKLCDCTHMSAGPLLVAHRASGLVALGALRVPVGQRQIHLQDESRAIVKSIALYIDVKGYALYSDVGALASGSTLGSNVLLWVCHDRIADLGSSACSKCDSIKAHIPHLRHSSCASHEDWKEDEPTVGVNLEKFIIIPLLEPLFSVRTEARSRQRVRDLQAVPGTTAARALLEAGVAIGGGA